MDWNQHPLPLDGMKENVLHNLLHYAYGQCLRGEAKAEALEETLEAVKDDQSFAKFVKLGQEFKKKSQLCESKRYY